jgi:hypothetical protein
MTWIIAFIAILAVIIVSDSLVMAILLISLLVNVMLMMPFAALNLGNLRPEKLDSGKPNQTPLGASSIADSLYGPDYSNYDYYRQTYLNSYKPVQTHAPHAADTGYTIDSAMARLGQQRTRDKQMIDGAAVKDANFYRYHYADELDRSEAKPWWGQYDY